MNTKKIKQIMTNPYFVTSFLIIGIFGIYLAICKTTPFGENTILKGDSYTQYVNFLCYLRDVLLQGKGILLSWNLGLANNFYTTFAYYLASPINLLVIFFNEQNMYWCFLLIILCKLLLMGNAMVYYFRKVFEYKGKEIAVFAILYVFSGYVFSFYYHIMWLDALYLLPIMLVMIEKYIRQNKIVPYIIVLGCSLLINYYTGFMVAIFSGFYYVARYITVQGFKRRNIFLFIRRTLKLIGGIILSFFVSAIILLPTLIQLASYMQTQNVELWKIGEPLWGLLMNSFFNNHNGTSGQKIGQLFAGTLTTVLAITFFFHKKIPLREKLAFFLLFAILLLPVFSPVVNMAWHGFSRPNNFEYRFSFVTIFTIIYMAFRSYQEKQDLKKRYVIYAFVFCLVLMLIQLIGSFSKNYLSNPIQTIVATVCLIGLACLFLAYLSYPSKINKIMLLSFIIFDLLLNPICYPDTFYPIVTKQQYHHTGNVITQALLHTSWNPLERISFVDLPYGNSASAYGYGEIGYFTSARNRGVIQNMYELGYNIHTQIQLWITSYAGSYVNDAMASVHYIVTDKDHLLDKTGYQKKAQTQDSIIYKNESALPIGYYISAITTQEVTNPFEIQNQYIKGLNNTNEEIKDVIQPLEQTDLVQCIKEQDQKQPAKQIYTVTANKDVSIYLYTENIDQWWDTEGQERKQDYGRTDSTQTGVKQITTLKQGQNATFSVLPKNTEQETFIYVFDDPAILQVLNQVRQQQTLQNVSLGKHSLKANAIVEKQGYLMFGIAYDEGWNAYVNGKKVEVEPVYGAFVGIPVQSGNQEIKLSYLPKGLIPGAIISGVSIVAVLILAIIEQRRVKNGDEANSKSQRT